MAGRRGARRQPEESAVKRWIMLVGVLPLLLLVGCGQGLPQAREMDDMALMRTMGVDRGDAEGEVLVTVSSSRRARGIQGEQEPPLVLSAQRASIAGACQAMQGLSGSYVFYGHLDQLLLGEGLAADGGVPEALEHFSRDQDLGLGTQVWLIRGDTAQAAIQSGRDGGIDARLTTLLRDSELGAAGMERTAGEVLTDHLESGCAFLPALRLVGEDGELSPLENGYGVLKDGLLAFWVTGGAARGLELSQGHTGGELLELEQAVVRLNSSALTCVPVLEDGELTGLELDLRLIAQVEQPRQEEPDRERVKEQVREQALSWLKAALAQSQAEGADYMGLGRMAGTSRPEQWKRLSGQWEEKFPELAVQVRCTVVLTDMRK